MRSECEVVRKQLEPAAAFSPRSHPLCPLTLPCERQRGPVDEELRPSPRPSEDLRS